MIDNNSNLILNTNDDNNKNQDDDIKYKIIYVYQQLINKFKF
jgi:hypothetical protein